MRIDPVDHHLPTRSLNAIVDEVERLTKKEPPFPEANADVHDAPRTQPDHVVDRKQEAQVRAANHGSRIPSR